MDNVFYYNDLFDIYGELLTDKQKDYFKAYYFDNLSYGEIALKYDVSRNAVFKQLKICLERLEEFEKVLHINNKNTKLMEIINKTEDNTLKSQLEELL